MNLILGFGYTGASFIRYLNRKELPFLIMDSRLKPPGLSQFKHLRKENMNLGYFDETVLKDVSRVLVSPGIEFDNVILQESRRMGIKIQTDVDIFIEDSNSKIISVTGTSIIDASS